MKETTQYFLVKMFEVIFIIMGVATFAVSIWSRDIVVMGILTVICAGIAMLIMSLQSLAERLKESIEEDEESIEIAITLSKKV